MEFISALDRELLLWINYPAGQNAAFDILTVNVVYSPLSKGALFLAIFWGLWFERKSDRRSLVIDIIAAMIVVLVSRILQMSLPFHLRPLHTPDLGLHLAYGVDSKILNTFSSFPSDHLMLFTALLFTFWKRSRMLGIVMLIWTVFVIAIPRIYLGFHWPSDIIAGMIFGALLMLVVPPILSHFAFIDRLGNFAYKQPAWFYGIAFILTFEIAFLFLDVRMFMHDLADLF